MNPMQVLTEAEHREALIRRRIRAIVRYPSMVRPVSRWDA